MQAAGGLGQEGGELGEGRTKDRELEVIPAGYPRPPALAFSDRARAQGSHHDVVRDT